MGSSVCSSRFWVVGKQCISGVACSTLLLLLLLDFLGAENYCICSAVVASVYVNTERLVGWLVIWMDDGWKELKLLDCTADSISSKGYVYEYDRLIIRWISS